jgi:hypothetical protein
MSNLKVMSYLMGMSAEDASRKTSKSWSKSFLRQRSRIQLVKYVWVLFNANTYYKCPSPFVALIDTSRAFFIPIHIQIIPALPTIQAIVVSGTLIFYDEEDVMYYPPSSHARKLKAIACVSLLRLKRFWRIM